MERTDPYTRAHPAFANPFIFGCKNAGPERIGAALERTSPIDTAAVLPEHAVVRIRLIQAQSFDTSYIHFSAEGLGECFFIEIKVPAESAEILSRKKNITRLMAAAAAAGDALES